MAVKKFPQAPAHPERVCWGCDLYCPAKDMRCGNGSDRTQHPAELFGDDWDQWGLLDDRGTPPDATAETMGSGVRSCILPPRMFPLKPDQALSLYLQAQ